MGGEVREATPAESMKIAARDIKNALRELDEYVEPTHATDHVRMYLHSALVWLGEA